jgi:UTP--glucose-1-phosphate uridylyltransferase
MDHGNLILNSSRFPSNAPLVKLGNHYKKVSDFQKRIPSIPRILELDHLTITGDVNLGKNVTLRGTVIIVASNNDTIDIPPGSILENVHTHPLLLTNARLLLLELLGSWSIKRIR